MALSTLGTIGARARVVGLTGGIASGKSAVASMLRKRGARIVDADRVARQVVRPGTGALEEIAAQFGNNMLRGDGTLDREKLGTLVFADADARKMLNAITHPRIAAESQRQLRAITEAGELAIYEAALIVENGLHNDMAALIVVALDRDTQLERLAARDSITLEQAAERIDAQLPLADKIAVADYLIDNSGSREETERQVDALWSELRSELSEANSEQR